MSDDVAAATAALRAATSSGQTAPPVADPQNAGFLTPVMPPYQQPPPPSADDIANATQTIRMLGGVQDHGAPLGTRIAVGAESSDADRLAALRKLQSNAGIDPDAALLPNSSNMVYTEPSTGRRTLYRGAGIGGVVGDVASVAPEMIGGALGGLAGAGLAAPSAVTTGPVGPAVGFGLGAAAGEEATRDIVERLAGTSDVRSVIPSLLNTATSAGTNIVAPELGSAVLSPLARAWTTVDPFNRVPSLLGGDLLRSPTMQVAEKGLYNIPGSAPVISAQAKQAASETGDQASQIASNITNATRIAAGQPPTMPVAGPDALGRLVQTAATRAAGNWQTQVGQLTQTVENAVGTTTPTSLDPLRTLLTVLQNRLQLTGETDAIQPAIDRVQGILNTADRQGGTLPWGVVRGIRTNVNNEIDLPKIGQQANTGSAEYQLIPGALSQALGDQANAAGPGAAAAWQRYNAIISNYRQPGGIGDAITSLAKPETSADTIASRFLSGAKGDSRPLAYLRSQADPDDWDQIAGSMFSRLGLAKPGAQDATGQVFSPNTFLTNWNQLSDSGKNTLFGGTRFDGVRDDIDYLSNLSAAQKSGQEFANPSGTARAAGVAAVLGILASSLAHGDIGAGLATAAGSYALPWGGAQMMTSRPMLQWIRNAALSPAGSWNANIARLGSVAAADPSMKGIVGQLQQNLPQQLPGQQP